MPEGSENFMSEIASQSPSSVEPVGMPGTPEGTNVQEKIIDLEKRIIALETKVLANAEKSSEATSSSLIPSLSSESNLTPSSESSLLPTLSETPAIAEEHTDQTSDIIASPVSESSVSSDVTSTPEIGGESAVTPPSENETTDIEHNGVPHAAAKADKDNGYSDFGRKFGTANSPASSIVTVENEGIQPDSEEPSSSDVAKSEGSTDGPPPVDGIGISDPKPVDATAVAPNDEGQTGLMNGDTLVVTSDNLEVPLPDTVSENTPKDEAPKTDESSKSIGGGIFGWLRGGKSTPQPESQPTQATEAVSDSVTTEVMSPAPVASDSVPSVENNTPSVVEASGEHHESTDHDDAEHPTDAEDHPHAA